MAKTNFQYEKRQKDLEKKRKKEEKLKKKADKASQPEGTETSLDDDGNPVESGSVDKDVDEEDESPDSDSGIPKV